MSKNKLIILLQSSSQLIGSVLFVLFFHGLQFPSCLPYVSIQNFEWELLLGLLKTMFENVGYYWIKKTLLFSGSYLMSALFNIIVYVPYKLEVFGRPVCL